jgi:putative SOS response-associated peptidase YedK
VLVRQFAVEITEAMPRYNIAPTQPLLVILAETAGRESATMRWGMQPPHRTQLVINARSETAASKPLFRESLRQRRCLVPADGFYEWQKVGGSKQPYFIGMRDESVFCVRRAVRWPSRRKVVCHLDHRGKCRRRTDSRPNARYRRTG